MKLRPRTRNIAAALLLTTSFVAGAAQAAGDTGDALRASYAAANERLANSPFHRPLYLDSSEADGRLEGSIHARIDQPFASVRAALATPEDWCSVLLLLPNIADCRKASDKGAVMLRVGLVRNSTDKPEQATAVRFSFDTLQDDASLQVRLQAPDGPLGTHDYRITLEAIPVADGKSFLYLRYAYRYGWAAKMAGKTYLAGSGSDKLGFSSRGHDDDGTPHYIGGLRGAVERNAMRCYLAIEAQLSAAAQPEATRFEASLQQWMKAIAQYPRQLKEDDPQAYRAAKLRDWRHAVEKTS